MSGITLDNNNEFVTLDGRRLGIFVHTKTVKGRIRFQYRDDSGRIWAAGMTPAEFVKRFWFRDDYQEKGVTKC